MKVKLLASSVLMAGALMASGSASADTIVWSWLGTLQNWSDLGSIVDSNPPLPALGVSSAAPSGDGDVTFKYIDALTSVPNLSAVGVSIVETELTNGKDYYTVAFNDAFNTGSKIGYQITTTDPAGFNWAELDTGHIGNPTTTKTLSVNSDMSSPFLLLTSPIGLPNEGTFENIKSFYVQDIVTNGATATINNNFSVPEPMMLVMLGIGLVGLGYSRRNALTAATGLSA